MQLTLPFNTTEIKKDHLELYPCASHHKEILVSFFSSCEEHYLNDIKKMEEHLTNKLISVLGVSTEKNFFDTKFNTQGSSSLEELISIIFQSRPLRHNGKDQGDLIRKRQGIYHTSYDVAKIIAREGLNPHINQICKKIIKTNDTNLQKKLYEDILSLRIIDPACGTGIILSAAVEYLCEINQSLKKILNNPNFYLSGKSFSDYIVTKCIFGVDIDPEACKTTRAILATKYTINNQDLSNNIRCGNSILPSNLFSKDRFSFQKDFSLIFEINNGFDVLIMNPPYERLKIDKSDFSRLAKSEDIYETHKNDNSNLVKIIKKSNEYPLSSQGILDKFRHKPMNKKLKKIKTG